MEEEVPTSEPEREGPKWSDPYDSDGYRTMNHAIMEILSISLKDKWFADTLIRRLCVLHPQVVVRELTRMNDAKTGAVQLEGMTILLSIVGGLPVSDVDDKNEE